MVCNLNLVNRQPLVKLDETLGHWSRDKINFYLLENGPRIVSPPHFVYDYRIKVFFMLYYISWPNFIVWLPLLPEMLGKMSIPVVCFPGSDVINFEINLSTWPESQDKIINILRTKRAFKVKWKSFFIIFKRLSVGQNFLRPESSQLNWRPEYVTMTFRCRCVSRRPLVLHVAPYGDVLRMSFGYVIKTSSGSNFVKWNRALHFNTRTLNTINPDNKALERFQAFAQCCCIKFSIFN